VVHKWDAAIYNMIIDENITERFFGAGYAGIAFLLSRKLCFLRQWGSQGEAPLLL